MKHLASITSVMIILSLVLLITACTTESKPDIDPYHPKRPKDIPFTTCSGDTIEWNWKKQRAYNEKRLFLERDSNGCILMIIIKIK
jgi:hypothetical protein